MSRREGSKLRHGVRKERRKGCVWKKKKVAGWTAFWLHRCHSYKVFGKVDLWFRYQIKFAKRTCLKRRGNTYVESLLRFSRDFGYNQNLFIYDAKGGLFNFNLNSQFEIKDISTIKINIEIDMRKWEMEKSKVMWITWLRAWNS